MISHVVGFDDAPFGRDHRGAVPVVGAVYAGERLDGVLVGRVRRDGVDATRELVRLIAGSRFAPQLQLIMLQGIAVAGFNVVDVPELAATLAIPVLVIARRQPDPQAIRRALIDRVRGGHRKWRLIERLGPMEPCGELWVQRAGIDADLAAAAVARFARHGHVPEPLRTAHLIAGAIGRGESRGRA